MAGRGGYEFSGQASGMSSPVSATGTHPNLGRHRTGQQLPQHHFEHQCCHLCRDNPHIYTSRSELSDHATANHRAWYSAKDDRFVPISIFELEAKRKKKALGQAHRRHRHDHTVHAYQFGVGGDPMSLPLPREPRYHPDSQESASKTTSEGGVSNSGPLPRVIGLLGADLRITAVDGSRAVQISGDRPPGIPLGRSRRSW